MPKTTRHGGASDKTRWKVQNEDGSAREGASAPAREEVADGVGAASGDLPRAGRGRGAGKKSAAKRVSQRRDTAGDGT